MYLVQDQMIQLLVIHIYTLQRRAECYITEHDSTRIAKMGHMLPHTHSVCLCVCLVGYNQHGTSVVSPATL